MQDALTTAVKSLGIRWKQFIQEVCSGYFVKATLKVGTSTWASVC